MPRYMVQRTFPDGLAHPDRRGGRHRLSSASSSATRPTASRGCTPTCPTTRPTSFCVYDGPDPEAIRRTAAGNDLPVNAITGGAGARSVLLPLRT